MVSQFSNIAKVPELKRRILFSVAMLAVFRIGVFVTVPGVDRVVMNEYMGQVGGLFSLFNLFTGGAMEQVSIFALGIMPYISASIIISLVTVVIPQLEELKKEGESGQRKINQYTRYGTVLICLVQGIGVSAWLASIDYGGRTVVTWDSVYFYPMAVLTLTTGSVFLMWLGEQITEKGIGNGISLLIFAGIVARIPAALYSTFNLASGQGDAAQIKPIHLLIFGVLMIATIGFIIFMERGQRRIPIQYAKRVVGRKVYGGQSTHLPLRINTAGVIPPIFASSILMFPATLANFWGSDSVIMQYLRNWLQPGTLTFNIMYIGLIVFFTFFYTAVQFNPADVADNLKKYGGFIPGIRPGKKTAEYIDTVLGRITVGGAIYLSAICVLPTVLQTKMNLPFYFGGTSLLIVVGVALDTVSQVEAHLITRHYEGFTGSKGPRIRGRKG